MAAETPVTRGELRAELRAERAEIKNVVTAAVTAAVVPLDDRVGHLELWQANEAGKGEVRTALKGTRMAWAAVAATLVASGISATTALIVSIVVG